METLTETRKPRVKKQTPEHIANLKKLISAALKQSWTAQFAQQRFEAATRKYASQVEDHKKAAASAWAAVSAAASAAEDQYRS